MFGKFSVHAWGAIIPRGAKMRMAPMSRYKCSCFKPPHQFQACTENLHNIESFVCKITNSRPKLWLNYRTYVIFDNLTKVKKTTHTHTHTNIPLLAHRLLTHIATFGRMPFWAARTKEGQHFCLRWLHFFRNQLQFGLFGGLVWSACFQVFETQVPSSRFAEVIATMHSAIIIVLLRSYHDIR